MTIPLKIESNVMIQWFLPYGNVCFAYSSAHVVRCAVRFAWPLATLAGQKGNAAQIVELLYHKNISEFSLSKKKQMCCWQPLGKELSCQFSQSATSQY